MNDATEPEQKQAAETPAPAEPAAPDASQAGTSEENPAEGLKLPNTPIKRRTLQAVIIPPPQGATLTRYIMSDGERYAKFEELTAKEREIVLEFLLRYSPPLIARKPKPRTPAEADPRPEDLDPAPIEALLRETEETPEP